MVVDAVLNVRQGDNADLRDIQIVKKLGGTVQETELIDGVVFDRKVSHTAPGGVDRVQNAKIAMVQFCLSAPKADHGNDIVVSDYAQMDRVLRDERQYILNMCKKIKKAGCNVVLVQKSILREAISDLVCIFLIINCTYSILYLCRHCIS